LDVGKGVERIHKRLVSPPALGFLV
jgi:hypothetical protein